MPRALVVINPVSGTGNNDSLLEIIESHLTKAGWLVETYRTTGTEVLKEVMNSSIPGLDLVVAAGGDGTASQAAGALVGNEIPLGLIPTGTWNALARTLGIPLLLPDALALLTGPHTIRKLDALEINGSYHLLNTSTGYSASTVEGADRASKRRFGFLAYGWNILGKIIGVRQRGFHLVIDGKHRRARGVSELMIVNSSFIGIGEMPTRLNIQPDDGQVEVCIFRPRSIFGFLSALWNILVKGQHRRPDFLCFPAREKVVIRSKRQLIVQADGDVIGHTPVEVNIVKGAVSIIVPERK